MDKNKKDQMFKKGDRLFEENELYQKYKSKALSKPNGHMMFYSYVVAKQQLKEDTAKWHEMDVGTDAYDEEAENLRKRNKALVEVEVDLFDDPNYLELITNEIGRFTTDPLMKIGSIIGDFIKNKSQEPVQSGKLWPDGDVLK